MTFKGLGRHHKILTYSRFIYFRSKIWTKVKKPLFPLQLSRFPRKWKIGFFFWCKRSHQHFFSSNEFLMPKRQGFQRNKRFCGVNRKSNEIKNDFQRSICFLTFHKVLIWKHPHAVPFGSFLVGDPGEYNYPTSSARMGSRAQATRSFNGIFFTNGKQTACTKLRSSQS